MVAAEASWTSVVRVALGVLRFSSVVLRSQVFSAALGHGSVEALLFAGAVKMWQGSTKSDGAYVLLDRDTDHSLI